MYYIYVYYLIKRKSNNNQFDKTKSKQQSIEIFFCIDISMLIFFLLSNRVVCSVFPRVFLFINIKSAYTIRSHYFVRMENFSIRKYCVYISRTRCVLIIQAGSFSKSNARPWNFCRNSIAYQLHYNDEENDARYKAADSLSRVMKTNQHIDASTYVRVRVLSFEHSTCTCILRRIFRWKI